MGVSRRCFIGSLVAGAGAVALAKGKIGAPDLRVGILSDTHTGRVPEGPGKDPVYEAIERALEFFKRQNADAVLIAGDFTNGGTMKEMRITLDLWKKVFGAKGGPEKIWVMGNHEKVYFDKAKKNGALDKPEYADGLYLDIQKNWQELFGEPWTPFFIKKVKGYSFVGAHWGEWWAEKGKPFREFLAAHKEDLGSSKPFFYTQHAHPQNTCYGKWTWHQWEGGPTSEILADYPNAVAFSGHTHYSLTDERSVWQGAFTSVGTGSMRWLSLPAGRENYVIYNGEGQRMGDDACGGASQGMLMSVWGDQIVLERYDFRCMEKLGEDWVLPVLHEKTANPEFSFANRKAKAAAPEFAADAKISVTWRKGKSPKKEDEDQLVVSFPAAVGRGDSLSRPFDYEVACEYVEDDIVKPMRTKRVYNPGVDLSLARAAKTVTCVFGECELPIARYRISVTPFNSFGQRGKTICLADQKPRQ